MIIKFIILYVVFATSMRVSRAQQGSTVYGLSEEKSAEYYQIVENQQTTLSLAIDSIIQIFDVLQILSNERKYNLQCETLDHSRLINEALKSAKTVGDRRINSLLLILEGPCPAAEDARNTTAEELANAFEQIGEAISLAVAENYTDVRTEFEPFSNATKASFQIYMEKFFDTIRTCVNTTDAVTLDAIKVREIGATESIVRCSDAVFDAIKIFASRISSDKDFTGIVADLNGYRRRCSSALEDDVNNSFSALFRGLFLSTQLNKPERASSLISNQHVQIVSDEKFQASINIMFDVMKGYLIKVQLGLSDGCKGDSSAVETAQVKTAEALRAGFHRIVDSVKIRNRVISIAVNAALKFIDSFTDGAAEVYFNGINLARGLDGSSSAKTLRKIQIVENGLNTGLSEFVRVIFTLVKLRGSNNVGVTEYQDNVTASAGNIVHNIFKGTKILANACGGVKTVTKEDFDDLETARNRSNAAVRAFDYNISRAHVSII